MQKVLILTYYWPPSGGAGVQRWLKFVKYMQLFNWQPIVYTVNNGEMPVIDETLINEIPNHVEVIKTDIWEPYHLYKKFIGRKKEDKINASFLSENKKAGLSEKISVWIRGNFFIPDARRFWIKPSIHYLEKYIQQHNIQFVISSGPPHSMHMIALGLKQKFKDLKWLADFRDPWTNIDFYEQLMLSNWADKKHHQMEMQVLENADKVVSVGQFMSDEFIQMCSFNTKVDKNKFITITNGYDESDLPQQIIEKDKKFSLAHIGTLVKDRNPHVLWKVLKQLSDSNQHFRSQLEIKLVGKVDISVMEQINFYGLEKFVNKIDYLPHHRVIEEQQRSQVLLLLVNNTKNAKGILTGKFFEYMASGSPILAIGPVQGELAKIINDTGSGYITDFEDESGLQKNIIKLFEGQQLSRNQTKIEKFSRKNLTQQLCQVLSDLAGN